MKSITVAEAFEIVNKRNLSMVRSFLTDREGFSEKEVADMELEYKRFIALCAVHASPKNPIPISNVVDPFWHTHILFTHDYVGMAKDFGFELFHHNPASGDELLALEPAYNNTLKLYGENFGQPDPRFWPAFAQICGGSGCSCSGTGNE